MERKSPKILSEIRLKELDWNMCIMVIIRTSINKQTKNKIT